MLKKNWLVFFILFLIISFFACKPGPKTLFTLLPTAQTSIGFSNRITENDSVNILDNQYVYNGGGVAIGDLNNDGLQDVYLSGNMVSNKLYLNRGDWKFLDVTKESGATGEGRWCSGISFTDINTDGLLDIYVCATFLSSPSKRRNLLYINKGIDKDGVPHFYEMAQEYGIADTTYSTNAAFFDYDRDGDLDLYVLVDWIDPFNFTNTYHEKIVDGSSPGTDRLYRNDWSDSLKHPVFTDVSKEAGIVEEGYGLGIHVSDINSDGWPDIYVANDFISNDLLYMNNRNGTFTNKAADYFKHTSFSAMGTDFSDINNDGLQDIITLDMLPEDNLRKKMMLNANNYSTYQNTKEYKYEYQYVRNTLQLNMGNKPGLDSQSHPVFSDIAFYANVASTDWSWAPLVVDFDNDGFRDIIITNGFPKDITDHDFIAYRASSKSYDPKKFTLEQIPSVKITNYAFRNNGDLTFTNVTKQWGITLPSFSNGAAYGDLDNDGDMDYVVNNIDDSAHVYRNNLYEQNDSSRNYIRIKLKGNDQNSDQLGAFVEIRYGNNKLQVHEHTLYRGYLSTVEPYIHFGLGADSIISNIRITWPDGHIQELNNTKANQVLTIEKGRDLIPQEKNTNSNVYLLTGINSSLNLEYIHRERDYIDFNVQKLLPHKLSQYGPSIAVADVNNDNLDDFFVGGSYGNSGSFFIQTPQGKFLEKKLESDADPGKKKMEDAGVLLFDADKDGDPDLYIASGGYENPAGSENYRDRFYLNDGKGNFRADTTAIPNRYVSKSCVKAADFDRDGDLDLFVGGRIIPAKYPMLVSSFIFRNDTRNGQVRFTDITAEVAPLLNDVGMICDMLWTDFDNDNWPDIILAGEWMSLKFFKNNNGKFRDLTSETGLQNHVGWWNSLVAGDFDNDGDMDYVAGNCGLNTFYKANFENPVRIYASDFNNDGGLDAVPSLFLPDVNGVAKEFPAFGRDDMIKQMINLRARFDNYKKFSTATIQEVLTKEELEQALTLHANYLSSSLIINRGNGKFQLTALPLQAQLSSIFGMVTCDIDGDNKLDLVLNGNDYGTEVATGRYDALNGLVLRGDGKGNFVSITMQQSGLYIPGDGKALAMVRNANQKLVLIATQNQGPLLFFATRNSTIATSLNDDDVAIRYEFTDGSTRKEELFWGHSFYSQSGRCVQAGDNARSITVIDFKGRERKIK